MAYEGRLPRERMREVSDTVMYAIERAAEEYNEKVTAFLKEAEEGERQFGNSPLPRPPEKPEVGLLLTRALKSLVSMKDPEYLKHLVKRANERVLGEGRRAGIKSFTKHAGLYAPPSVQTSNCPDHPHIRLGRVPGFDRVFVCPLDGKKYDFNRGFEKYDGEFVPGSSVEFQIPDWMGNRY